MDDFTQRLKYYRENTLGIKTRRAMAEFLNMNEMVYSTFERGARSPSKQFIKTLVAKSGMDEAYWLYGREAKGSDELECTMHTIKKLIRQKNIDKNTNFTSEVEDILLSALKTDIKQMLLKLDKK